MADGDQKAKKSSKRTGASKTNIADILKNGGAWYAVKASSRVAYMFTPDDPSGEANLSLTDIGSAWPEDLMNALQFPSDCIIEAMRALSGLNRWEIRTDQFELPATAALTFAVFIATNVSTEETFQEYLKLVQTFFDPDAIKSTLDQRVKDRIVHQEIRTALANFYDTLEPERRNRKQLMSKGITAGLLTAVKHTEMLEREKLMDTAKTMLNAHQVIAEIEETIGMTVPELFEDTKQWQLLKGMYELLKMRDSGSTVSSIQVNTQLPDMDELLKKILAMGEHAKKDIKYSAASFLARELVTGETYRGPEEENVTSLRECLKDMINGYTENGMEGVPDFKDVLLRFLIELRKSDFATFGMSGFKFNDCHTNPRGMVECRDVIRKASHAYRKQFFNLLKTYLQYIDSKVVTKALITHLKAWFDKEFPEQNGTQAATTTVFFWFLLAKNQYATKTDKMNGLKRFYNFIDVLIDEAIITPDEVVAPATLVKSEPRVSNGEGLVCIVIDDDEKIPQVEDGAAPVDDDENPPKVEDGSSQAAHGKRKAAGTGGDNTHTAKKTAQVKFFPMTKPQQDILVKALVDAVNTYRWSQIGEKSRPDVEQAELRAHTQSYIAITFSLCKTSLRKWPDKVPTPEGLLSITNYSFHGPMQDDLAKLEGSMAQVRLRIIALSIQTLMAAFSTTHIPCPEWCTAGSLTTLVEREVKGIKSRQAEGGIGT